MAKAKSKAGKKKKPESGKGYREVVPKQPRAARLPGTEDGPIKPLEDAAHDYADVRDRRMALSLEERAAKVKILGLMKEHGKEHYQRADVEIDLVMEKENVKVRIGKSGDGDEDGE